MDAVEIFATSKTQRDTTLARLLQRVCRAQRCQTLPPVVRAGAAIVDAGRKGEWKRGERDILVVGNSQRCLKLDLVTYLEG